MGMCQWYRYTHTQSILTTNMYSEFTAQVFLSLLGQFLDEIYVSQLPIICGFYLFSLSHTHTHTLTMQLASCSLPNRGLMKGAIWRQRNVCTDTGKPRSCSPSSWSMSKSSLLLFGVWLLLFACRLLLFVALVTMVVASCEENEPARRSVRQHATSRGESSGVIHKSGMPRQGISMPAGNRQEAGNRYLRAQAQYISYPTLPTLPTLLYGSRHPGV